MPSKKNFLFITALVLFVSECLAAAGSRELQQKKLEFLKIFYSTYDFTASPDYRDAPHTLGKYFTDPIYRKLKGNDLIGFLYDEGFAFSGDAVQILECRTSAETARFANHFSSAFREAAADLRLKTTSSASCQVGVCLVAVVEKGSQKSLPGVVAEFFAKNVQTGKQVCLRIKSGSRSGWLEAMKDICRYFYLLLRSSATKAKDGK